MKYMRFLIIFTLVLSFFTFSVSAEDQEISILADNVKLRCDVPPVIIEGRTLVPVRVISEHNSASVTWYASKRLVTISTDSIKIELKIDDANAILNGKPVPLEVPATIIDDRTMVPVRFVAEAFGYTVDWDDTIRSVILTSPEIPEENSGNINRLKTITAANTSKGYRVSIKFNSKINDDYSVFELDNPKRVIIDIKNADIDYTRRFEFDNDTVLAARAGNHDEFLRVVLDLDKEAKFKTEQQDYSISIYFDIKTTASPTPDEDIDIPEVDGKYTVVIDPGHGGSDPGAIYKEEDITLIEEDDLNLKTALIVQDILEEAGINVIMTRDSSEKVTLSKRCTISNEADADLFVSIHSNAMEEGKEHINGTMVFYGETKDLEDPEIYSKTLAENTLKLLCKALDTKNLGVQSGDELAVIRGTDAPAVLIELAFITNPEDREKLMDDNYLRKAAIAIAEGIIKTIE